MLIFCRLCEIIIIQFPYLKLFIHANITLKYSYIRIPLTIKYSLYNPAQLPKPNVNAFNCCQGLSTKTFLSGLWWQSHDYGVDNGRIKAHHVKYVVGIFNPFPPLIFSQSLWHMFLLYILILYIFWRGCACNNYFVFCMFYNFGSQVKLAEDSQRVAELFHQ